MRCDQKDIILNFNLNDIKVYTTQMASILLRSVQGGAWTRHVRRIRQRS